MDGELLVAIVGVMIAPLYGLVYYVNMRVEHRLTKIEAQCVFCKTDTDKKDEEE